MIKPSEVAYKASEVEDENYAFRVYLKERADADTLDKQFKTLHDELFAQYDCSKCRNCCKMFHGTIPKDDISKDAMHLGLSETEFVKRYLTDRPEEKSYQTKNQPCDFLDEYGTCGLGDCKPTDCREFPYTNKPDRLGSLLNTIEMAGVCPVVYEIIERLKTIYHFEDVDDEEYEGNDQILDGMPVYFGKRANAPLYDLIQNFRLRIVLEHHRQC